MLGHQTHCKAGQNQHFFFITWTGTQLAFLLGEHPNHKAVESHYSFLAAQPSYNLIISKTNIASTSGNKAHITPSASPMIPRPQSQEIGSYVMI